jgi:hypothetical protein
MFFAGILIGVGIAHMQDTLGSFTGAAEGLEFFFVGAVIAIVALGAHFFG